MVGGKWDKACDAIGEVRLEIGRREKLINETDNRLLWVTEFPMFEYHEDDKTLVRCYHPPSPSPRDEDVEKLDGGDLGSVYAKAYDLVLNGTELGGGSVRIHRSDAGHCLQGVRTERSKRHAKNLASSFGRIDRRHATARRYRAGT